LKKDLLDFFESTLPDDTFKWTILEGSSKRNVTLLKYFYGVQSNLPWKYCQHGAKLVNEDDHHILSDGSLEIVDTSVYNDRNHYCFAQVTVCSIDLIPYLSNMLGFGNEEGDNSRKN
jgi:hypothetical protein